MPTIRDWEADSKPDISIHSWALLSFDVILNIILFTIFSYQGQQEETVGEDMDYDRPLFQGAALFAACR